MWQFMQAEYCVYTLKGHFLKFIATAINMLNYHLIGLEIYVPLQWVTLNKIVKTFLSIFEASKDDIQFPF